MAPFNGASEFVTHKVLGIDVNERYSQQPSDLDVCASRILNPAEIYLEDEPTVKEWLKQLVPTKAGATNYLQGLFPSSQWVRRYNLRWLLGDTIAGITIGLVVVPQAMAYAALAQLPPAYGLYTSFTGAALYWLFGTSKDIVIGTTAVGSLLVGQVVSNVQHAHPDKYTNPEIAHAVSLMAGAVMLFFGICRLGWIIEFIPYIPISAFVTAASITIMSTQVPVALGIPGINTRESPYKVIINTLKSLPNAQLDAAIGVSSIVLLFLLRGLCSMMEVRQPTRKRTWATLSSLRLTFTMLLYTLISYLVHRTTPEGAPTKFRIVGTIEPGFQAAKIPSPDVGLLKLIVSELPAIVIILIIEHIAIAKSMGRLFNYTVIPSQEIVALGAANLLSPFIGGYVCTGSFGASAVLSKAGVRTPLAGLLSALVLILALYVLTRVFYFIPNAALAGLIIHAVCNLITPPKNLFKYWQLSPLELLIWITGVVMAIFKSLETAIYAGIALSLVLLLVRTARTKGRFMGTAQVKRVVGEYKPTGDGTATETPGSEVEDEGRTVFMPLDRKDASNPDIDVHSPCPGVFIYRFSEGYNYTNQAYHVDTLLEFIKSHTQQTPEDDYLRPCDRPWNDSGPRVAQKTDCELPHLRAIICDFSAVNNLDVTSVQGLNDLRNSLNRYAAPDAVEWHFANVQNRWTRRALAASGFGYPTSKNAKGLQAWSPSYSISSISSIFIGEDDYSHSGETLARDEEQGLDLGQAVLKPVANASEAVSTDSMSEHMTVEDKRQETSGPRPGMTAVYGVDRPFFHIDLTDAVDAAVRNARRRNSLGSAHCTA